jgi:hypothetical protein
MVMQQDPTNKIQTIMVISLASFVMIAFSVTRVKLLCSTCFLIDLVQEVFERNYRSRPAADHTFPAYPLLHASYLQYLFL